MKTVLPMFAIILIGGALLLLPSPSASEGPFAGAQARTETLFISSQPAEEKPIWHSDWPTAQRLAKQANKPIFAVLVCKH